MGAFGKVMRGPSEALPSGETQRICMICGSAGGPMRDSRFSKRRVRLLLIIFLFSALGASCAAWINTLAIQPELWRPEIFGGQKLGPRRWISLVSTNCEPIHQPPWFTRFSISVRRRSNSSVSIVLRRTSRTLASWTAFPVVMSPCATAARMAPNAPETPPAVVMSSGSVR